MPNLKIKAKVIKRKDIREDYQKIKKAFAEEGEVFNGYFIEWPKIDGSFFFWTEKGFFRTSIITEVINNRTFLTKNSIYEIITLEDERDEKIDKIIG